MNQLAEAKNALQQAWEAAQRAEKYGVLFGKTYFDWEEQLTPQQLAGVCRDLKIDQNVAGWWRDRHLDLAGFKKPKKEARINRSEPPDSFEDLRKIAIKMLNIGFDKLWSTGDGDRSHLSSAKAWAYGRLKEKE